VKKASSLTTAVAKWIGRLGVHMAASGLCDYEADNRGAEQAEDQRPPARPPHPRPPSVLEVVRPQMALPGGPPAALRRAPRGRSRSSSPQRDHSGWGPPAARHVPASRGGAPEMHSSHVPWRVGIGTAFCGLCGAYSQGRRSPALADPCPRRARNAAKDRHLRLLMDGRHPVTKESLGTAFPVRV
jgi:hypothetical protein